MSRDSLEGGAEQCGFRMARLNVWLSLLLSGAALRACVAFQPSAQHRSRVAMRMSERDTSSTPAAIDRRQALAPLLLVPGLLLAADGASAKSLLEKRQGGYYQMVDEPTEVGRWRAGGFWLGVWRR